MVTPEHAALRYLDCWLENDGPHHETLTRGNRDEALEAISNIASLYRIARHFPSAHLEERFGHILDTLRNGPRPTKQTLHESVAHLVKLMKRTQDRELLSAATKFLWHYYRSPVVIHDDMVRNRLGTDRGDYPAFEKRWRIEYSLHKKGIANACARLPQVKQWSRSGGRLSDAAILSLSTAPWFQERVFDFMIWLDR